MALSVEEMEKRIADSYELPNNVLERVPRPLVSVRTSTYNHGPYIRQCIEGVLMQKTNFPFEFIIGEDFSTDETREIVFEYAGKYPDVIRVITADYNVGSKTNGRRCIRACRGKYIATCEGDDYWTDPLKLQKQVDFLEANPGYVLTCHRFRVYDHENDIWKDDGNDKLFNNRKGISFNSDFSRWLTKTLTMLYRRDALDEYFSYKGLSRDTVLVYFLLKNGKLGYCFNENMGVYRLNNGGIFGKQPLRKQILDGYYVWRDLYDYEPNRITRKGCYSAYASVFVLTHGTILFKEKLDVVKVLSVPYFLLIKSWRLLFRLLEK